ncbi:MAG TPA: type II toxin-antitoxin system VapC family toxin [Caulobacteraceae bacterium]|nr:type II toxin-antitoxin system VapC family toxin [Caulobacteraceae bacterium]
MTVVIDASVALKWVLDEPGQAAADGLLDEELVAPSLWLIEAANALWRRSRRGEISNQEARDRLVALRSAPVATSEGADDLLDAADLAAQLDHPVYDCLYLAVALREDAWVVTADERFLAAVARSQTLAGRVRLLGSEA